MGRGRGLLRASVAVALSAFALEQARAQTVLLPVLDVTASRLTAGIAGASTSVITAEDLQRAPEKELHEIIGREAGAQTTSLYGGVNSTGGTVDVRGFGVTSPSNVLVLVDGRRFNDSDLTGFDFSLIPRNSIDHIEITRGNSGAVLYGDGAVGAVINIVTKKGAGLPPNARIEGGFGSFNTRDVKVSASASSGPLSGAAFGNYFRTDGYRLHNETEQKQAVGKAEYRTEQGSVFLNVLGDRLNQNLPGPRNIANGPFVGTFNQYVTDPRGTNTPLDNLRRDNWAVHGGVTRMVWDGVELIVDGSTRQKETTFASFNPLGSTFLVPNQPSSYNLTDLETYAVTPRVNVDRMWGDVRVRMIAGADVYKTDYESKRALFQGAAPNHVYDLSQQTTGFYAQPTLTFFGTTDVAFGGRTQRNSFSARDVFDPAAPVGPLGANPQGLPLDKDETNHAWHLGIEHRFSPMFAVFGRAAQSFRVPNIDERIGQAPVLAVTNFDLRTQKSHDIEGGVRVHFDGVDIQSSVYDMRLTDELHFSPITFANTNLDPTHRYGWETTANWRVNDRLRLKGSFARTRAVFREGPFTGKDVPEVARWSGSTAISLDLWPQWLTFDGVVRFTGKRFADGDEANAGAVNIPSATVVDLRLSGTVQNVFWSFDVLNAFDRKYYEYALDTSFTGNTFVSVYPLPGRTFMVRAGATF